MPLARAAAIVVPAVKVSMIKIFFCRRLYLLISSRLRMIEISGTGNTPFTLPAKSFSFCSFLSYFTLNQSGNSSLKSQGKCITAEPPPQGLQCHDLFSLDIPEVYIGAQLSYKENLLLFQRGLPEQDIFKALCCFSDLMKFFIFYIPVFIIN